MPRLIVDDFGVDQEFKVKKNDNEDFREKAQKVGIPFSCEDGTCGVCQVDVVENEKSLGGKNGEEGLTEREAEMGMPDDQKMRLACQCQFKDDKQVKIKSFV